MKKNILLTLLFLSLGAALIAQDNYFLFNGISDVKLRNLSRGSGGRSIVHWDNNILVLNFSGDFTGGTQIHSPLLVREKVTSKGLFLNNTDTDASGLLRSYIQYPGETLVIGSTENVSRNYNIDLMPGGISGKTLTSGLNMYVATGKGIQEKKVMIHTQGDSFFNGGNIGIGTANPTSMLDVRGRITAREVKIEIVSGADFVFAPDYNLRPLTEVETFVKENKHLPEIPSEKKMQEEGISVNEMQIKLLQKVEELTLYIIDQDKGIKALEEENKTLKTSQL